MEVSEEERNDMFEAAWAKGGLRFRGVFSDLLTSEKSNEAAANFIKSKIRQKVTDPDKAEILSDIDHPYAAKRPPIDTNYFETFNRENVSLVNLKADPIKEIIPGGISLKSGDVRDLDVIIFAKYVFLKRKFLSLLLYLSQHLYEKTVLMQLLYYLL